jgi:hypothetical protein
MDERVTPIFKIRGEEFSLSRHRYQLQVLRSDYYGNPHPSRHLELSERSFVNQWQKSCLKTGFLSFWQKIPLGMTRQRECRQTIARLGMSSK